MNRFIALVASVLAGAMALGAAAAGGASGPPVSLGASADVQLKGATRPGESVSVIVTERSEAVAVSAAELGADAELIGSNGQKLGVAAAASAIYATEWSQRTESLLWGIAWNETHRGYFYFNGSTVWLKSRYGWDTSGYHRCGYNWGAGFSVSVKNCWKTGDPSGSRMTNGDQFQVSVLFKGFPISATHEMRACMYPSGYLVGC